MKRFLVFLCIALIFIQSIGSAQNAGQTGTQTMSKQVWNAITSAQRSAILQNIGQASHYITFCGSAGGAFSFDVEESPDGTTWVPFSSAITQLNARSNCGLIVLCGYFNNVSLNGGPSAGTLSAWYSASTGPGPCGLTGNATTGQAPLPICDNLAFTQASGNGSVQPILPAAPTYNSYYCNGWTISLSAPLTGAGTIALEFGNFNCTSVSGFVYTIFLSAATPLVFTIPPPVNKISAGNTLCAQFSGTGTGGINVDINYSYANY